MRAALLLLLLVPGCARSPAPPTLGLSVPDCDLPSLVGALGSEDPRVRQDASARLRGKGEAALEELGKAKAGKDPSLAAQAGRVSEGIEEDLTERERFADACFVEITPPSLPEGTWVVVALGRLAASGPSEDSVRDAAPSARHRYLWRVGEGIGPVRAELGSLSPGDYGRPVLEAFGREPLVGLPDRADWAVLGGASPEDWKEDAVALGVRDALRLGLARFEIPGIVTVRSRMGAGVLTKALRARARVRKTGATESRETTVWILEDRG